jgi:hypothetical protein
MPFLPTQSANAQGPRQASMRGIIVWITGVLLVIAAGYQVNIVRHSLPVITSLLTSLDRASPEDVLYFCSQQACVHLQLHCKRHSRSWSLRRYSAFLETLPSVM